MSSFSVRKEDLKNLSDHKLVTYLWNWYLRANNTEINTIYLEYQRNWGRLREGDRERLEYHFNKIFV
jgi:hypothetical protein